MILYEKGSISTQINQQELKHAIFNSLDKLGKKSKVIAVPPDFTRFHSQAGLITSLAYEYYNENLTDILPALGTHTSMTIKEIEHMFPGVPAKLFRVHDWRKDVVTMGTVSEEYIDKITNGALKYSWPAQLNKLIAHGGHDLILSIGQVVPHEVIGMANYNKNLLVGTGGPEGINKSHFIGAVYGMEKIMGRADNPVRKLLNYATNRFMNHLPVIYILTIIGKNEEGKLTIRGLFIGDDEEVFLKASELSLKVNFNMLDVPLKKVVVYLDPAEFRSTWLGNKSIYRTRMALEDGGELIVLAPGLKEFGEDKEIDRLIRKYGYCGKSTTLRHLTENDDLRNNLSAAAHLIHGSSEDRFSITYCPGNLTKKEIESANFKYGNLNTYLNRYDTSILKEGYNTLKNGEDIFYISNPALGLWSTKDRFEQ